MEKSKLTEKVKQAVADIKDEKELRAFARDCSSLASNEVERNIKRIGLTEDAEILMLGVETHRLLKNYLTKYNMWEKKYDAAFEEALELRKD